MVELGKARNEELDGIGALLAPSGLPHQELAPHLAHFTVAREDGRIVGVIGLEVHGADGVMRSLVVAPGHRGRGMARRLYAALLREARESGVARLFLIAPVAQSWFTLLGFHAVPREALPEAVGRAEEFRELAPTGALLMVRPVHRA